MNKHLGTDLLATRTIQASVEHELVSRRVGFFKFKGFGSAKEIYELLGEGVPLADSTKSWRDAFEDALQLFQRKRFTAAEPVFRETIRLRQQAEAGDTKDEDLPAEDGPSVFYLKLIEKLKSKPPPDDWVGEVDMDEK